VQFTEVAELFQVRGYTYFGAHGACWGDINGDGLLDLFVTNQDAEGITTVADILFINYGTYFRDEADIRGVADAYATGTHGATFVDLDHDRDLDLFVSSTYGGVSPSYNHLYQNNGNGVFTDITSAIMPAQTVDLSTRGVTAGDFDNDGDIDFYFSNPLPDPEPFNPEPSPPQALPNFYINDGSGTYTTEYRGIDWTGFTQGVTSGDYDGDGDLDIAEARWAPPATIYRNDGTGNFRLVGGQIGLSVSLNEPDNAMNLVDMDNDGDLDIAIVGSGRVALYRNTGSTYYRYQVIFTQRADFGFHAVFADFDNDTVLELYLSGENFYENDGEGLFTLVPASEVGLEDSLVIEDGRGAAAGDFDNDGDIDVYIANKRGYNRLFRNDLNNSDWLEVEILSDTRGHAGSVGTKLDLYTAGHLSELAYLCGHREIQAATGYCTQDSPIVHFGAPSAGMAKYDLKVTFPDGTERVFINLDPGQKIQVAAISPPLNVEGRKIENRALFYRETIVELTWEPNPMNNDVQKYRIYESGMVIGEVSATQFSFTIRNLDKAKSYTFAVTAVDSQGLESQPAYANVATAISHERGGRQTTRTSLKRN
jgi:hypothetical protein